MDAQRFKNVEESEQSECDGKKPGVQKDCFCWSECETHKNSADFVNDNPAGIFGAGVFHGFFHEGDGRKKDYEGGGKKCEIDLEKKAEEYRIFEME